MTRNVFLFPLAMKISGKLRGISASTATTPPVSQTIPPMEEPCFLKVLNVLKQNIFQKMTILITKTPEVLFFCQIENGLRSLISTVLQILYYMTLQG